MLEWVLEVTSFSSNTCLVVGEPIIQYCLKKFRMALLIPSLPYYWLHSNSLCIKPYCLPTVNIRYTVLDTCYRQQIKWNWVTD